MDRIPCRNCRDEHGERLPDFPATAPWDTRARAGCSDPECKDGWIELEPCGACGELLRSDEIYRAADSWVCVRCSDGIKAQERRSQVVEFCSYEGVRRALGYRG
jgi:hypothetical protein